MDRQRKAQRFDPQPAPLYRDYIRLRAIVAVLADGTPAFGSGKRAAEVRRGETRREADPAGRTVVLEPA